MGKLSFFQFIELVVVSFLFKTSLTAKHKAKAQKKIVRMLSLWHLSLR